jgi:hypothetical protein
VLVEIHGQQTLCSVVQRCWDCGGVVHWTSRENSLANNIVTKENKLTLSVSESSGDQSKQSQKSGEHVLGFVVMLKLGYVFCVFEN